MKNVQCYPSSKANHRSNSHWLPWRRLSVSPANAPIQDKVRNLRKKIYFEDLKPKKKINDLALKVEVICLKNSSKAAPSIEKGNLVTVKERKRKSHSKLNKSFDEDNLKDYFENNAITSLPPIELINRMSFSPKDGHYENNDAKPSENTGSNVRDEIDNNDSKEGTWNFYQEIHPNELDKLNIELFDDFYRTFDRIRTRSSQNHHRKSLSDFVDQTPLSLTGKHVPNHFYVPKSCTPNKAFRKTFYPYINEKILEFPPKEGIACQISHTHIDQPIEATAVNNESDKISPWQTIKHRGILKKIEDGQKSYPRKGKNAKIAIENLLKEKMDQLQTSHIGISTDNVYNN